LLAAAIAGAEFDAALMRRRATECWVTVTELADFLARDHELPFRTGHSVAAKVVRLSRAEPDKSLTDLIAEASKEVAGREIRLSEEVAAEVLSPEHFIAVRKTWGGPAPEVVGAAIDESRKLLAADQEELARLRGNLSAAERKLEEASAEL
jgi:argininosuccinate lyase